MNEHSAITAFASLSNPTRLRMLKTLVRAGTDGLSAGSIADIVGATPSRASFHLSNLTAAGIVSSERQSQQIVFRVNFTQIGSLVRFLLEDCCQGDIALDGCCRMAKGSLRDKS